MTFDLIFVLFLATLNTLAFIAFGFDKWQASGSRRRVSERTLVSLGALGGWLGGLAGMQAFRHKTAKRSFKVKYTLALIPFAAEVWVWLHWR